MPLGEFDGVVQHVQLGERRRWRSPRTNAVGCHPPRSITPRRCRSSSRGSEVEQSEAAIASASGTECGWRRQHEPTRCQCSAIVISRLQRPCMGREGRLLMQWWQHRRGRLRDGRRSDWYGRAADLALVRTRERWRRGRDGQDLTPSLDIVAG